jgi:hypothetical protein
MQHLKDLIKLDLPPPKLTIVNERQYIIQDIVDRINKERVGTKWKPVTWTQINGLLRNKKDFQLNLFYCECKKRSEFGKYFFWAVKIHEKTHRGNK